MKDYKTRELKAADLKIRETEDGKRTIEGIIPFNKRSEYMGFYEYIAPSAFNKTLADGADVRALQNHDTNKLLGRVKNGSLRLRADDFGLHIECDLPDTSYGRDVYNLIQGGYNNGLSFGFTTIQDRWEVQEINGREEQVCYLLEVRLYEVSFCVTFPAYEDTSSSVRDLMHAFASLHSEDLSDEDRQILKDKMRELIPEVEPVDPPSNTPAEEITEVEKEQERQLDEFLAKLNKGV